MSTVQDLNHHPEHDYGVPAPGDHLAGVNSAHGPHPDPSNVHVVHFSATRAGILSSNVLDHKGALVNRFESVNTRHLQMDDAQGQVFAIYENGRVKFDSDDDVKVGKFLTYGSHGNTGAVVKHDGESYEILEEVMYGIVRTTPGNERVAIVYNHPGSNPKVETVGKGIDTPGLQARIVFATALVESGVMKKQPWRIRNAVKGMVSRSRI